MLSPDSLQSSETTRSLDVSNNTNAYNGRSLDDGTSLDNFLLVDLRPGSVDLADDVGHAGLVSHEAGQMNRLGGVILREALDLASEPLGSLLGQEALRAMSRRLELSVRLKTKVNMSQDVAGLNHFY